MPTDRTPITGALSLTATATLAAAAVGKDGKKGRRFEIIGYTGEPLTGQGDYGWSYPVVVDLAGIDAGDGVLPILYSHKREVDFVVGQSETAAVENGAFLLRGPLFGSEETAKAVIRLADAGFRWQASIGANSTEKEFVGDDIDVKVNGRTYTGPLYVSRKTTIREVSFVVIGDDGKTTAVVATGAHLMAKPTFAAFCKAKYDTDEDKMSAKMKAKCQAEYDDDESDDDEDTKKKKKDAEAKAKLDLLAAGKKPVAAPATTGEIFAQYEEELRAKASSEIARQREVKKICAGNLEITVEIEDGRTVNLVEHAIAAGWTKDKTALEFLRADRPNTPHLHIPSKASADHMVLTAAAMQAGKLEAKVGDTYEAFASEGGPSHRERFTEQQLDAAHSLYRGRIGLQQLLVAAARQNGYRGSEVIRDDGDIQAVFHSAFRNQLRGEGASTGSIGNVLSNVQNKFLLAGYMMVEQVWKKISAQRPVKDFKPTKSINLLGDFTYQQIGNDGHLANANLEDEAFANQANTYGRIAVIGRKQLINDDLSALTTVPKKMGRGAGLALNKVFWTTFLNPGNLADGNAFYFGRNVTTGLPGQTGSLLGQCQSNLITGTPMTIAGLTAALAAFRHQVDPNGYPIELEPAILLVPVPLEVPSLELFKGGNLVYGGASTAKQPNVNVFSGKFEPTVSAYLDNPAFTGYSAAAWYMLGDPDIIPVIECCFLNGQEQPTVQTAQAEFQTLGITMRGFWDFGVTPQNFRGGVKATGS